MAVRRKLVAIVAVVVITVLAGCSAVSASFNRPEAQADVSQWTGQAVRAVESASAPRTTVSGFEICRTDSGFFTTSNQWRTGTDVAVAQSRQAAATEAIVNAFAGNGWKVSVSRGLTTLSGPGSAKRKGLVQIQTAGPTGLAIQVISPCYA
jgi:hypothetical protein